jgi:hypothetical protein
LDGPFFGAHVRLFRAQMSRDLCLFCSWRGMRGDIALLLPSSSLVVVVVVAVAAAL